MMRKIFLLLLFIIVSNCSYFDTTSKVAVCPKLTSPKGTEEVLLKSKSNVETYVGFRGIKSVCYEAGTKIKMILEVNVRAVREQIDLDEYLPITLALVSVDEKRIETDRDEITFDFFLRAKRKLIERKTVMEVIVSKNGEALLGIIKK